MMRSLFHSTVLATTAVATLAVGIASAAIITRGDDVAAPKADRLPVAVSADGSSYVTVETRSDGVSVLKRLPVDVN